jgi:hypothetical protein
VKALDRPDVASAGDVLRWLVTSSRERGSAVNATNIGWGKHTSPVLTGIQLAALGPLLNPSDQLRYRIGTSVPRHPVPGAARREWRNLLLALEQRIVLAEKRPGMLADDLSDYLFARSTGHIGSLMTLIIRGCHRAVRTGREHLDRELLDQVKNDAASEKARQELQTAFNTGRLATKLGRAG